MGFLAPESEALYLWFTAGWQQCYRLFHILRSHHCYRNASGLEILLPNFNHFPVALGAVLVCSATKVMARGETGNERQRTFFCPAFCHPQLKLLFPGKKLTTLVGYTHHKLSVWLTASAGRIKSLTSFFKAPQFIFMDAFQKHQVCVCLYDKNGLKRAENNCRWGLLNLFAVLLMRWSGNNAIFGMWHFICSNSSVLEYVKWYLQVLNSSTEESWAFSFVGRQELKCSALKIRILK